MKFSWNTAMRLLYGAEYNPEQWTEEIRREDLRLMKKAGVNAVPLGVFSWAYLEPEEGRFEFDWLDDAIAKLAASGISVILATPSAARPPWMAKRYPEVLRVNGMGIRNLYGERHNHCPSSPVYRRKVAEINWRLARRYGSNEAVILWHVSNEYNNTDTGECHCELCQAAFREDLRRQYGTLDRLNAAWWTSFWSHRFTDWDEISIPCARGDYRLHGLTLAWRRFVTRQVIDFFQAEVAALREFDSRTPVTTNFMGAFPGLDYFEFARHVDVVSWNSYPDWHSCSGSEAGVGAETAMLHDMMRGLKSGQPFLLMECAPSLVNWKTVNKLKRPGMNCLEALQAVAHGSDSVFYFQWRKSRGASEKFHGAVVDHSGREDHRVFEEVAATGREMSRLGALSGSRVPAEAALLYDWHNRWAIDDCKGFRNDRKDYLEECQLYYKALWERSISTDCIDQTCSLDPYKLVVAPMLYLLRPGFAEKLEAFVRRGGTLVATCGSGWVDEDDLVFPEGQPGPLVHLLGLTVEEADSLYDGEIVKIRCLESARWMREGEYAAKDICERIHPETAVPLAVYASEFYAGEPCLTENRVGEGRAYYVAFRTGADFVSGWIAGLAEELRLRSNWPCALPGGVNVQRRCSGEKEYLFVMNFNPHPVVLELPGNALADELKGGIVAGHVELPGYGVRVLTATTLSSVSFT